MGKTKTGLKNNIFTGLNLYLSCLKIGEENSRMPKEESILENYFMFISNFSHDRAREVIEKEKELSRGSSSSCWSQLLSVLLNLSTAEKTYHSLTFLSPRTGSVFLRKEQSLKSVYQSLLLDCRNALELRKSF